MKEKATLKQIAKDLGVSVSTVSKALNGSPEISETTRTRVSELAKLRNYKPNALAKNLKNQRTYTLAVVIPNMLNPFFAKVFSGIEKAANARNYNLITYISNESSEKERLAIDLLSNGTVDGFIFSLSEETQKKQDFLHFKQLSTEKIPYVLFDRVSDMLHCDKVIVDDYDSALNAMNHFFDLKCRKIALVTCIGNLSVGKLRINGYKKGLENVGIPYDDSIVLITDNELSFNEKIAEIVADSSIDAVFGLDEHASTMAMKVLIRSGRKIPEDVCIIGFADGIWSRRLTPSMSTISQHGPEIGETAANLLIDRIENKEEEPVKYLTKVIKTELRQRDSTKK